MSIHALPNRGYGEAPGSTVGSVVCTDLISGRSCEAVDVSLIHFSSLPEDTIDKLIEGLFPSDCPTRPLCPPRPENGVQSSIDILIMIPHLSHSHVFFTVQRVNA